MRVLLLSVLLSIRAAASPAPAPAPAQDGAEAARGLTRVLAVELGKSPALEVLSSADLRQVLALEADRQGVGCEAESCLADVAGAMGARFVVFGELVRVDSSLMFTAMLYDSELASSRGRVVRRGPNVEALIEALPGAVGELVGPTVFGLPQGTRSRVLVLDIRPPAPLASVAVVNAQPQRDDDTLGFAVIGAGSVLAVVGGAYDYFSPTSNDERFGAEDLIGAGFIGFGVAVGIAGVVLVFNDPVGK